MAAAMKRMTVYLRGGAAVFFKCQDFEIKYDGSGRCTYWKTTKATPGVWFDATEIIAFACGEES